jgi:hypothetical protein
MGRVDKGVSCSVKGCANAAERSISRQQLAGSSLSVASEGHRVYLCKEHYREWKKGTKKSRDMDRSRWG